MIKYFYLTHTLDTNRYYYLKSELTWGNGYKGVPHIAQSSRTGDSQLDAL